MVAFKRVTAWEEPKLSVGVLVACTALFAALRVWTILTLAAYVALVYVIGLFLWQSAAKMTSVSPPPPQKIIISEPFIRESVESLSKFAAFVSAFLERLSTTRDAALTGQVVVGLVILATIGKWFNFLTLIYLAMVASLVWPLIYKKHRVEIDDIYVHGKKWIESQLAAIPGLIPRAEVAKKKT